MDLDDIRSVLRDLCGAAANYDDLEDLAEDVHFQAERVEEVVERILMRIGETETGNLG